MGKKYADLAKEIPIHGRNGIIKFGAELEEDFFGWDTFSVRYCLIDGCGMIPATQSYGGMAITPLTVVAGTVVGAVCGAVFTPCMAVKGLFDTFTLGAFVDEDYDITDTTDIVEDKVDFVNDIATLNNPFEDDEEVIEIVVEEEEEEAETEEEPEPETETEEE